jgi:peptidoglycan-associated lipoprotein
MNARLYPALALAMISPFAAGCASKGWVRDQLQANNKVTTAYVDSAAAAGVAKEAAARQAADTAEQAQIASLRAAIDSLRTQFNTTVTSMGKSLRFAVPVHFAFNDATVTQDADPVLDRFGTVVSKYYPGSTVTVEGFADPAGTKAYNLALSKRRADNVAEYLTSHGMSGDHMRTVGYGKTRLVNPGAARDDAGAEENRRVVFVIETAGTAQEASAVTSSSPRETGAPR